MTSRALPVPRSAPAFAVFAGAATALACLLPATPALAAANPGQAVANDYGQSDAEVTAEVNAVVVANASVIHWNSVVAYDLKVVKIRYAQEVKALAAYRAAIKSRVASRIASTKKAYLAAHATTAKAKVVYNAAVAKRKAVVASVTAAVRATHYRPVDGTYDGRLVSYLVPTTPKISFEPLQVRITVYGGHVSDVSVIAQAPELSDSNSYNVMSLSTLCLETMTSGDTAAVAAVSGASLTSEAFQQSLQAALVAAGFKA
jgi:uncharacterized protein with FMN-binding domain